MCDQRSRVLPFGLSIATYPLAVLTAFGHGGVSGLIGNLLCGVGIYAIFAITNHLFRITGGADAVGAGDRRLVPAIATACGFHGTVYGMGAMCIAMLANYIPATVRKRSPLKPRYPWAFPARLALHRRAPWVYHVAVYPAVPRREVRSSRSARNN